MTASGAETVRSVTDVANSLRNYIGQLPEVWIEGQLAEWNPRPKAHYGKLKDLNGDATISLTAWNSTLEGTTETFKQGDKVRILAKPEFWVGGGSISFIVKQIRHEGLGDILEKIERLRRELAAEGVLDPARKKPLPFLPLCIGLVTAKDSDAEKDVVTNARLRWSDVKFRAVYTAVQGDQCAPQVAAAIATLDADPEVDVIIVTRGGGDFLNLLPFSDELVVRAAVVCETPLVSAIGHENDRPLLDEVADLRASTPTDAAKRVVPDVTAELDAIAGHRSRAFQLVSSSIAHEIDRIAQFRNRPVMASPLAYLERHESDLRNYVDKGQTLVDHLLDRATDHAHRLTAQLRTLSPQNTLDRGYAIVRGPKGMIVAKAASITAGDQLSIQVADGDITATAN
ncbi:MAG: exodeoxyribonuclease VII large subunit [Microbacteriaceae bacterium]